jgi:hypothetical protein
VSAPGDEAARPLSDPDFHDVGHPPEWDESGTCAPGDEAAMAKALEDGTASDECLAAYEVGYADGRRELAACREALAAAEQERDQWHAEADDWGHSYHEQRDARLAAEARAERAEKALRDIAGLATQDFYADDTVGLVARAAYAAAAAIARAALRGDETAPDTLAPELDREKRPEGGSTASGPALTPTSDAEIRAAALLEIVERQRAALIGVVSDLSCPNPQVASALNLARDALEVGRVVRGDETAPPPDVLPAEVLAGLPPDLAAILRDQSVVVPQDARVWELIAKWARAPSNTASADPGASAGEPTP